MGKLIISGPSLIIVFYTILFLNKLAVLFVLGSALQVFSDVIIVEQALVGNQCSLYCFCCFNKIFLIFIQNFFFHCLSFITYEKNVYLNLLIFIVIMIHMFLFHLQMSQFYNSPPPPLSNPHYYNILRTNHHVTKQLNLIQC